MTAPRPTSGAAATIDDRTAALMRLAVLVVLDAPAPAYEHEVAAARAAGADDDEVIATLAVVAPNVGLARTVAAAPALAAAVGYDLEAALEAVDHLEVRRRSRAPRP